MQDEITYKLLKSIDNDPHLSQREIAQKMGVSLGKTNYCLKALLDKGFIKIRNFYNHKQKKAYIYILTPNGIEEKAQVTYRFLQRKIDEFEIIKEEIESLKSETGLVKSSATKEGDDQ